MTFAEVEVGMPSDAQPIVMVLTYIEVWWTTDHGYKNAITNELFLTLSARGKLTVSDFSWAQIHWRRISKNREPDLLRERKEGAHLSPGLPYA